MTQLPQALEAFAAEPPIQSLLFVVGSMAARASEICDVIGGLAENACKPVCVSWHVTPALGAGPPGRARHLRVSIPRAASARLQDGSSTPRWCTGPDRLRAWTLRHSIERLAPIGDAPAIVPEPTCHRILAAAGLAVAAGELVGDEAGALRAAEALGLPVVLKGITPRITHRANAGLVAVDLRSEDEVRVAHRRLHARAAQLGTSTVSSCRSSSHAARSSSSPRFGTPRSA